MSDSKWKPPKGVSIGYRAKGFRKKTSGSKHKESVSEEKRRGDEHDGEHEREGDGRSGD